MEPADSIPSLTSCLHVFYIDDRKNIIDSFRKLYREYESFDIEFRIAGHLDEVRFIRGKGQAVMYEGSVVKLNGTLLDITEQKIIERKLVEAKDQAEPDFHRISLVSFLRNSDTFAARDFSPRRGANDEHIPNPNTHRGLVCSSLAVHHSPADGARGLPR